MNRWLIVFAKEPRKGKVKTRLHPYFSEKRIIAYQIDKGRPLQLRKIAPHFLFYQQRGVSLGQRMSRMFECAFGRGASHVVIIGSDSPTVPVQFITKAFAKLNTCDLVIGPSHDGGYYLIGLKKSCPDLFKKIQWSSSNVFSDTLEKAVRLNKKVGLLKKWYDVDDRKSFEYLKEDIKHAINESTPWTKRFLGM